MACASDSWWSVIQMSSTAIEMDLYNTSDCAGQASRLTVKPGDCPTRRGSTWASLTHPEARGLSFIHVSRAFARTHKSSVGR
jgi:hypothetical protein